MGMGKVRKKSVYKRLTRIDFLSSVKKRLENDVEPYFNCISDLKRTTNKSVGFWALVRMILPVIDAVSEVIYRKKKEQAKPIRLLEKLGIRYPNLVWEMFRHSLIHNDELRPAVYRGQSVTWEIRIGGNHEYINNHIALDMRQLYEDFIGFLDEEIAKSDKRTVYVERGVKFGRSLSQWIKKEFQQMSKLAK